jgi:D-alanyl-lipoteichoic acid acyltransferase DltB (MBOAT superfamily)
MACLAISFSVIDFFLAFRCAVAPLREAHFSSRHAATPLRIVFINFHQLSYFFYRCAVASSREVYMFRATPLRRYVLFL